MGDEMLVAVGAWADLGRVLDTQRTLARPDRAVARSRLFQSRVESARFAVLWLDRSVLDWSPLKQHISRVLHGSVSTAPPSSADPIRRAATARNGGMFCSVSAGKLGVAVDTRGAVDWIGDH